MRIAFNCLASDPNYVGGVNTFTFGLLKGFKKLQGQSDFRIQVFSGKRNADLFKEVPNHIVYRGGDSLLTRRSLWALQIARNRELFRFASDFLYQGFRKQIEADSDLIYIPTTTLFPYTFKKPTLVSLHDIQHVHFPHFFSKFDHVKRNIHYNLTAERSNFIQASTQFIKDDLLKNFKMLKEEQIVVIPEGVDLDEFSPQPQIGDDEVLRTYKLPEKFLFFPAQLWPHKNHLLILKALKHLRSKEGLKIPLVLTGAAYEGAAAIFEFVKTSKMDDQVFYLGKVPFEHLKALYRRCHFLITAVLYESSSLPILEAAASGAPVIASRVESNLEMAQNLQMNFFDAYDPQELIELLPKIWEDEALRSRQKEENLKRIRAFEWQNIASQYLAFARKVA